MNRLRALLLLILTLAAALPLLAQEAVFETDALNPGLGAAPGAMDRSTPMATMEAFLHLTNRKDYAQAAHLLDLTNLPQADQQAEGARRAEELAVLLERKAVVPWGDLADRPDGWLIGSSDDEATGRVRRSIVIYPLELRDHNVPLRLNRIKPGDADAVWVFSRQTVDNIPDLFDLYGPTELEKQLPGWLRVEAMGGMYLWEVLFLPILLAIAVLTALLAYRLMRSMGQDAPARWLRYVGRAFKLPVAIALFAAILGVGTQRILVVSGIVDAFLNPVLVIAYVFAATLALVQIADEIFDMLSKSDPNELADPENSHLRAMATTVSAARKFLIVIAVLVGTGIVLSSINTSRILGFSLLASAGALTVILGFAAREVLGNILASVQIAMNRSARIGDQLIFEGHFCTVERIHFTYVQLLIWNGTRLIVPVSYFVSDAFENWSLVDPAMVRPITLTLAQGADVDAMRDAFIDLMDRENPDEVAPRERAAVNVTGQDVFGLKVRFELPTKNPATAWDIECRVREGLQEAARRIAEQTGNPVLPPAPSDKPDA